MPGIPAPPCSRRAASVLATQQATGTDDALPAACTGERQGGSLLLTAPAPAPVSCRNTKPKVCVGNGVSGVVPVAPALPSSPCWAWTPIALLWAVVTKDRELSGTADTYSLKVLEASCLKSWCHGALTCPSLSLKAPTEDLACLSPLRGPSIPWLVAASARDLLPVYLCLPALCLLCPSAFLLEGHRAWDLGPPG